MFSVCIGSHLSTDHERSAKTKAQTKFQAQLVGWLEQQVSGQLGVIGRCNKLAAVGRYKWKP